jgi:hypothetical protein
MLNAHTSSFGYENMVGSPNPTGEGTEQLHDPLQLPHVSIYSSSVAWEVRGISTAIEVSTRSRVAGGIGYEWYLAHTWLPPATASSGKPAW